MPQGGIVDGQCDVIVATPGRLVDLVENLRGFTLQHARYLIVTRPTVSWTSRTRTGRRLYWMTHQNLEGRRR